MSALAPALHQALSILGPIGRCALLNYPNHLNIGDHLIWCGAIRYLDQQSANLTYVADLDSFSQPALEAALGSDGRVFLHGGGSLGDLWPDRQQFHEHIISTNPKRPVVIFPQTVYFEEQGASRRAADVFNSHPDLTLFVRDHRSRAISSALFHRCRVVLAPDMAFALEGLFEPAPPSAESLYLARLDKESHRAPENLPASFVREDWISYHRGWRWGSKRVPLSIPLIRIFREVWQRRLACPDLARQRGQWLSTQAPKFWSRRMSHPWHRFSLGLAHDGMRQLNRFGMVVTDRLHAHLFCLLLGIRHVLLPNSYFKNQAFHESWTSASPICQFASPEQLPKSLSVAAG